MHFSTSVLGTFPIATLSLKNQWDVGTSCPPLCYEPEPAYDYFVAEGLSYGHSHRASNRLDAFLGGVLSLRCSSEELEAMKVFSSYIGQCYIRSILKLRGGETEYKFDSLQIEQEESDHEIQQSTSTSATSNEDQYTKQGPQMSWISPKRLWTAARTVIGRTTGILRFNRLSPNAGESNTDTDKDTEFAELDSILEQSDSGVPESRVEEHTSIDSSDWLSSEPSPPKGLSLLKGWNQRSLRNWIKKVSLLDVHIYHLLLMI